MEAQLGNFDKASELFNVGIEHCPRCVCPAQVAICQYLRWVQMCTLVCHMLLAPANLYDSQFGTASGAQRTMCLPGSVCVSLCETAQDMHLVCHLLLPRPALRLASETAPSGCLASPARSSQYVCQSCSRSATCEPQVPAPGRLEVCIRKWPRCLPSQGH